MSELFADEKEKPKKEVSPGHPIHILLTEHEIVRGFVEKISALIFEIELSDDFDGVESELSKVREFLGHLREYEKHKVREENSLFPYLEKHGVTQPPAIMWAEHDEQRKEIKGANKTLENKANLEFEEFRAKLVSHLVSLAALIPSHFYKEENILFSAALELIGNDEWLEIKASMDDLGYCYFTPKEAIGEKTDLAKGVEKKEQKGQVTFETGSMTRDELEAVLNTLPTDITFVDKADTVQYFSQTKERIFPRAKAIIGRKVQQCHPQESVHAVQQILDDFRTGRRSTAEFWIQMGERLIYIRYFAVHDKNGEYLGCLEATQDITDLKTIDGEKRLL